MEKDEQEYCLELDWSTCCVPIDKDDYLDDSNFTHYSRIFTIQDKPNEQKKDDDTKGAENKKETIDEDDYLDDSNFTHYSRILTIQDKPNEQKKDDDTKGAENKKETIDEDDYLDDSNFTHYSRIFTIQDKPNEQKKDDDTKGAENKKETIDEDDYLDDSNFTHYSRILTIQDKPNEQKKDDDTKGAENKKETIDEDDYLDDSNFSNNSCAFTIQDKPNEQKKDDDTKEAENKKENETQKIIISPPEKESASETTYNNKQQQAPKFELSMTHKMKYIHGSTFKKPNFPCYSTVNASEQASYLQLAQKFTLDKLPFLNRREQAELKVFMDLHRRVQAEQREYIHFARKQSNLHPINYELIHASCRTYIEAVLKNRQKNVPLKYHALYHYGSTIGLSHFSLDRDQAVEFVPLKELLSLGTVAYFQSPKFKTRTELPKSLDTLELDYPSSGLISPEYANHILPGEKVLYNTPVSEDENAARLAVLHDANVIISSSVMQALFDCHANHPQNCAPPRDIPVVIKEVQDADGNQQKVVFIDKLLPPVAMSLYDKKTWYSRKASKILFCQRNERIYDFSSGQEVVFDHAADFTEKLTNSKIQSTKVLSFNEELKALQQLMQKKHELEQDANRKDEGTKEIKLEENYSEDEGTKEINIEKSMSSSPLIKRQKVSSESNENENITFTKSCIPPERDDGEEYNLTPEDGEIKEEKESAIYVPYNTALPTMPAPNRNVVYGLWSIRKKQADRLADSSWERASAEIKLLVRTNYHAYEVDPSTGNTNLLHTSVKLEHQPQYGAQTSTVGEVAREWMALYLRPNSTLYRVHVNAFTMEVIQIQRLTIRDLMNEGRRRNLNPIQKLGSLHHVFSQLMKVGPGNYLLKLKPLDGWAELLCQDTSGSKLRGGPMFHLHLAYHRAQDHEGPTSRVPYSPIDTDLITPYHCYYRRVPGTYLPAPPKAKQKRDRQAKREERIKLKKATEEAGTELNAQIPHEHQDSEENEQNTTVEMSNEDTLPLLKSEIDEWFNSESPNNSQEGALMIVDEKKSDEDQDD